LGSSQANARLPWQQQSQSASSNSREPLRHVSKAADDNVKVDETKEPEIPTFSNPQYETANDSQQPAEPTSPRRQIEQEPEREPEEPLEPLPDLTKGIPSTLAAELEQAQSKGQASRSSLNITEDPAESLPGEQGDEGPRERTPRAEYVSSSDRKKKVGAMGFYIFMVVGLAGYSVYLGRNWESEELEKKHAETAPSGWGLSLFWNRVKARWNSNVSYYSDPVTTKLLPDEEKDPAMRMPFTLVLSLDDLMVHSEWSRSSGWRIAKRPGLDYFLRYLSQYYELVLFTTQPFASGEQVMRKLDPYMMIRWPLYREATLYKDGSYIKVSPALNCR
jgi:mitochondrial import inner membrane translocase subunit TIM50